jgi:hypothetical protein
MSEEGERSREDAMESTATKAQEAAKELEKAKGGVEDVLGRVRAGDPTAQPEDLQRAESCVRFAAARLEAALRIQEEEAERERLGRVEALGRRAVSELDPELMRELTEAARGALSAYVAACVEHNGKLDDLARKLEGLGPLPDGYAVDRTRLIGPRLLVAGDFEAGWSRPMVDVSDMARAALSEHIPHGYIDLNSPY